MKTALYAIGGVVVGYIGWRVYKYVKDLEAYQAAMIAIGQTRTVNNLKRQEDQGNLQAQTQTEPQIPPPPAEADKIAKASSPYAHAPGFKIKRP